MEYFISSIFGQAFQRYGAAGAILLVTVVVLLLLLAKLAMVKIDQMREDGRDRRDALERAEKRAQDAQRALQDFMHGMIAEDGKQRDALSKALGEIAITLQSLNRSLDALREDGSRRSGDVHEKLEAIHRDVIDRRPRANGTGI